MTNDLPRPSDDGSDADLPLLLRRPAPFEPPPAAGRLRGLLGTLLQHSQVDLDDDAGRTVVAGVTNLPVFRALVSEPTGGPTAGVSVLSEKQVPGGSLFVTPIHQRYVEIDVLPDLRNGRWGHLVHPATDVGAAVRPQDYGTHRDEDGRPLAVLTVRLDDRAALISAVKSSLAGTFSAGPSSGPVPNDYTDSVLQQGVKEPLLLFVLRVLYADGSSETFLMAGDGNSRLASLWKARTGGDLDDAAAAIVARVLGGATSGPHDPRRVRARVAEMSDRVRRGLQETTLTEQTIREGHTATIPAVVVLGMRSAVPEQPLDLVVAKDDLIAGLHVNSTPWVEQARFDQGMRDVLRTAASSGVIAADVAEVLAGRVDVEGMAQRLDLPPHPLWAAALWVEQLTGDRWNAVARLFRQTFGLGQARRTLVGARLGVAALSSFRSQRDINLDRALRTFGNGGPLTDGVLYGSWSLTRGSDARDVLDRVRDAALAGEAAAKRELVVLGGIAAMLMGILTRDRGSKERPHEGRSATATPYRRTPNALLDDLVGSHGGIRTLHSIAACFVRADGSAPKRFDPDGSPSMDRAGGQVSIDYEWDVFVVADPVRAQEAVTDAQDRGGDDDTRSEEERLRGLLKRALKDAVRASEGLARLVQQRGTNQVMGTPDFVRDSRDRAETVRDILVRYTPDIRAVHLDEDTDEDDEFGGGAA